jgi:dipeptidyl aminopeptidase/acylaminoacyl peptidase
MMISGYDNVAWQPPDGRLIAFAAATNGPTSDVYIVDTITGEERQLTDGPSQAILPSWSPDGRYIYHVGVSLVPPFGGAIVGFNRVDGAWAVRPSDGELIPQPPLVDPAGFVGWLDGTHYLILDGVDDLVEVDIESGKATDALTVFCPVSDAVQSASSGTLLLSVLPETKCASGVGVYLWDPAGVSEPGFLDPERSWGMAWLDESEVFQVYPTALFSSDGSVRREPPVPDSSFHPAVSRQGYEAWEVIENTLGRVVVRGPGSDWREILQADVSQLLWDPISGETLVIASQDGRLYAASAPDFAPTIVGNLGGGADQAIWVP